MTGDKYRIKCIGRVVWSKGNNPVMIDKIPGCGWTGIRTDSFQCECYDLYALYCRPLTPGPGCPRGIDWPCPRCGGSVTGQPVRHRVRSED